MIRTPAVAGQFYPADKDELRRLLASFDVSGLSQAPAIGIVSPHAGLRYSGPVAAKVYASARLARSVIMIGPNHRGATSAPVAISSAGAWEAPTGALKIDSLLAMALMTESEMIEEDPKAHNDEHSLEVQAPFITHFNGDTKIVPILLGRVMDEDLFTLADDIYRGIERLGSEVSLVASTDFSHYVPHEFAESQDHKAIEKIIELDATGLLKVVRDEKISMCGAEPTALVMEVCKKMGATSAELISYQTSGDSSGDYSRVVGYGGLVIR